MSILSKTLVLLPIAILLEFGVSIFYLVTIMYMTGCLPDVSAILNRLSDLGQIVEALKG